MEFAKKNSTILFGGICKINNQYQTIGDKFYIGISLKQEYLLSVIEYTFNGQGPTINQLSEIIGSSHQNIKQIADKLEKKGYIKIVKDAVDKRKRRIYFTEKYNEEKAEFQRRRVKHLNKVFEGITDEEIEVALKVMWKIDENQQKLLKEMRL